MKASSSRRVGFTLGTHLTLLFSAGAVVSLFFSGTLVAQTSSPVSSPSPSPSLTPVDPAIYLPQAVVLPVDSSSAANGASASKTLPTKSAKASASDAAPAPVLEVCTPGAFAITYLNTSQTVNITLTYNVACAGMNVTLSPLDGGTINAAAGPAFLTVDASGTAAFQFQAPAAPGLYNVLAVLGGYQRTLPFQVSFPTTAAN